MLSEHIKKQVQMFQMRGKGEMSCLKLFISIQHLSAFLLSQEERHFFPTNVILFMGDVLDVSFFVDINLSLWHLCLSGEPVEEWAVGEHAVLILGVSQLGQKSHGVLLGDLISC